MGYMISLFALTTHPRSHGWHLSVLLVVVVVLAVLAVATPLLRRRYGPLATRSPRSRRGQPHPR